MEELIKIKEMSSRYDISARTLRYYEHMGLLASTRGEDYAYRLYDAAAVTRLEQILLAHDDQIALLRALEQHQGEINDNLIATIARIEQMLRDRGSNGTSHI